MVIGMVLNRDLISKSLIDIKNTNARDLIRCLAIEKFFDCNVKTSVSLTEGGGQNCPIGHEIMDVSNGRSVKEFSKNNSCEYNYIFIDYYRVNDYYWADKLFTDTFFKDSIHSLWLTLKKEGCIFFPFLPRIVRNMIAHYHALCKIFKIEFVLKDDIEESENFLWRASDLLLKNKEFNYLMNCEETKNMNLGNVTKKRF